MGFRRFFLEKKPPVFVYSHIMFSKEKEIRIRPVLGKREIDYSTMLPYYLEHLKYGEIRERYHHLEKPTVVVIDNGISEEHVDFVNDISDSADFTGESMKFSGDHGTHCGSQIAGDRYGLSRNIPIANYKSLTYEGAGAVSWTRKALKRAIDEGHTIVSMSLGMDVPDPKLAKLMKQFTSNGTNFIVCASGNDGDETDYPAAYADEIPGVISVAAADTNKQGVHELERFSNRGVVTVTYQGKDVIGAGKVTDHRRDRYMFMTGTSMATPGIAALIAIAKGILPDFNQRDFHKIMPISVVDLDAQGEDSNTGYGFVIPELFLSNVELLRDGRIPRQKMPNAKCYKFGVISRLFDILLNLF